MVARLDTFGCELTLLGADTNLALCDPIHDELWSNMRFHLVVQECFQAHSCEEQIQRDVFEAHPKANWVPANDTGILPGALEQNAMLVSEATAAFPTHDEAAHQKKGLEPVMLQMVET